MSRGVVGIALDRDRVLFYRWRDAVDLEAALGGESIEEAIGKRGFRRLVVFMTMGLRHQDEKLTQERVIKILDMPNREQNYIDLWTKVTEALVESGLMPRPGESEAAVPTQAPSPGPTEA